MEKPKISKHFTINDIRKIREYNYQMTKNMTAEEERLYYRKGAEKIHAEIQRLREKKMHQANQPEIN
jgi:hypothetical protein